MVNNVVNEIENARILENSAEGTKMHFEGILKEAVEFIERNQICDVGLWQKFVNIFRWQKDAHNDDWSSSWRSEFWGKMMRGASMVVKYTNDDGMYTILEDSVRDMLTAQDKYGRITGYSLENEFQRWDLWGRKYVMLGMMYFMEISRDEKLNEELVKSMCKQADYIIDHVGPGKLEIRECSKHWEGMNSCSILEPIMRLYRLTDNKKYLEFAEYIISTGFIQSANLIELAYLDKVAPYEYPVVKAYEMMSCFEGLLQYYFVTGNQKYKTALVNFGKRIMEEEISIIGCSGCTHELFDHTRVRQTQNDYEGIVQETCVTVTWMKFALSMLKLTGNVDYADYIERSFYNAYLGSINTHRALSTRAEMNDVPQVLPFDSYAPLVTDRRGRQTGGYNLLPDKTFYGCCACIGAAGAGVMPEMAVLESENGITVSFYEKGIIETKTPNKKPLKITIDTLYPYDGTVKLDIDIEEKEEFDITLRVPAWCDNAYISVNGENTKACKGYNTVNREWQKGDTVTLQLEMKVKRILPDSDQVNADIFAAYTYGPIVLAADKRVCDPDSVIDIPCDENGYIEAEQVYCPEIKDAHICLQMNDINGNKIRLIDYASAGKTWTDESRMGAWLYIKK
ncbi:MAG: glycoside hydrolase family 127 protein [Clostridia bacterium]|nr:glycoside hydrolase family 127 protein [Clostridia bacterium]